MSSKKNKALKRRIRELEKQVSMDSSVSTTYGYSNSGGWSNPFNQFGLQTDPTFNTVFLPPLEFNHRDLTDLYQNPLIRRTIHLHRTHGTRKGLELTSSKNTDKAQDLNKMMRDRFNWLAIISKMIGIKHAYGGGGLYVDVEDGRDPKDPLNLNNVRKINYFHPVERWLINPYTSNSILGTDKPGHPLHYQVTIAGFQRTETFIAHESRIIRFPTFESDDVIAQTERARRTTWDVSTIQIIYDTIKRYGVSVQSMSQLLQRFVMDVFKVANLRQYKDPETLRDHVREQMLLRNSLNAVIIGEDDDINQQAVPTTGMTDINKDIRMDVSMVTGIPLSIFFSNESGNLGGTTTSEDRKSWYDDVEASQNNLYTPLAREMLRFLSYEQKTEIDDIDFKWNSLWSMSPSEQAELEKAQSETDSNYVNNLGASEVEILEARWGSGQFSQAVPDYDKEEFEKDLEEIEEAEREAQEKQLEIQRDLAAKEDPKEDKNNDDNLSQDDNQITIKIEK